MPQRKCDDCSKVYSCRQSLYAHRKICQGVKSTISKENNDGSQIPILKREVENVADDVESDEDLFQELIRMEIEELLLVFDKCSDLVDDEYRSKLEDLENLCNDFFTSAYGNDNILPEIETKLKQLEQSTIPRTELISVKILVNDIEQQRYIFKEMNYGIKYDDINRRWKTLAEQGLITSEDYHDLHQLNKPNLKDVISVLNRVPKLHDVNITYNT